MCVLLIMMTPLISAIKLSCFNVMYVAMQSFHVHIPCLTGMVDSIIIPTYPCSIIHKHAVFHSAWLLAIMSDRELHVFSESQ